MPCCSRLYCSVISQCYFAAPPLDSGSLLRSNQRRCGSLIYLLQKSCKKQTNIDNTIGLCTVYSTFNKFVKTHNTLCRDPHTQTSRQLVTQHFTHIYYLFTSYRYHIHYATTQVSLTIIIKQCYNPAVDTLFDDRWHQWLSSMLHCKRFIQFYLHNGFLLYCRVLGRHSHKHTQRVRILSFKQKARK